MDRPACGAELASGERCRGFALPGGRCWNHDPSRADERRAARSKGGKLRSLVGRRPKLNDAAGLVRFNADLVHRLLAADLEVDVVRCVVYALSLQRQLIESGDLERRLSELEQRLGEQGAKKWA